MSIIETRKLQQFIVLAEELNFHRAAERLHMAQPPLSAAIRQLEDSLGVRLFERSKSFVRITPAGTVFLREAYRVISALENATRLVQHASAGVVGNLRISFVPSAGYAYIPTVIKSFVRRYPQIEIHLDEGVTAEVLLAVEAGDAHVGFVRQAPGRGSELHQFMCQEEPLCAVLPADHPLSSGDDVALADLRDEDFIVILGMRAPGFRSAAIDACQAVGFTPRIRHEAATISTMIGLVAEGLGVALIHQSADRLQHPKARFLKLIDCSVTIELLAVWKKNNDDNVVRNFLQSLGAASGPVRPHSNR